MEFGIFQGASVGPRPWEEAEPLRLRQDVELGVAADKAGYDTFWAPEHHALEEYSHSSASHLSCLAVGMLTKNIRLVTGIFNLCPPINHPVRVAEQIATSDVLTNGRIELGTGRGSGSTEVNTFGILNEQTREMWEESIRAIPKMWTQDLFSWEGKHFSVPERCILPKPVQQPHPPLWVTATNPSTVETAAKMGLGVAMFSFSTPEVLRPLVEIYKENIEKAEPVGEFVNNKIMAIAPALCLEDGEEARSILASQPPGVTPHFAVYFDTIPDFAKRLENEPRPIPQTRLRELVAEAERDKNIPGPFKEGPPTPESLHENGMCVGNPTEVRATVQKFVDVGLDQLVTIPVVGRAVPHETCIEGLRIFGEKVIPEFRS